MRTEVVQVGRVAMARCACGGAIAVYQASVRAIGEAVQKHQKTRKHRLWWDSVRGEWQGEADA